MIAYLTICFSYYQAIYINQTLRIRILESCYNLEMMCLVSDDTKIVTPKSCNLSKFQAEGKQIKQALSRSAYHNNIIGTQFYQYQCWTNGPRMVPSVVISDISRAFWGRPISAGGCAGGGGGGGGAGECRGEAVMGNTLVVDQVAKLPEAPRI